MTPSEQRHRRHWALMTYPMRLRFVSTMFASVPVGEVVWETRDRVYGYHGYKWYHIEVRRND